MKWTNWLTSGVMGLIATMGATSVAQADPPEHAQAAERGREMAGAEARGDAAIHARFPDLGTQASRSRLRTLQSNPAFEPLAAALGREGVRAADLEPLVLPLVEGATPEEADTTLAAVMLHQYESGLKEAVVAGSVEPDRAIESLLDQDELLSQATYGKTRPRYTYSRRRARH